MNRMSTVNKKTITVIALCYNHSKFLIECLESIRLQTLDDFQLIITDDSSKDGSPELIATWLSTYQKKAIFLRHEKNVGICKTLNEAIALADGEYISMIATDDAWEPEKLSIQLAAIQRIDGVDVMYSDARIVDENGDGLYPSFIKHVRPDLELPVPQVFQELVRGNFIPAMSTLIRRQAILEIGGYDERLVFEDYDMWIRLSAGHRFAFCPGVLARYRIVTTSMARTIIKNATPDYNYSMCLIYNKIVCAGKLTKIETQQQVELLWGRAYAVYVQNHPQASYCLKIAFLRTKKLRAFFLFLFFSLGVSRERAKRIQAALNVGS